MRFIFILLVLLTSLACEAQPTAKEQEAEALKVMVAAQRFVFRAQSVTPTGGGGVRQLSTGYDLVIRPDSIISELPYYGRLYQAPMNSQDEGIKFISSEFEYALKDRKKGGWDIKVKVKDVRILPQLFLTVYLNGSATLRISCTDRQSISYNGIVEETRKK